MITRRLSITFAILLLASAATVRADSLPVIRGSVSGVELCPQSICGAAVFVGVFAGRVGWNPFAIGTVAVAVTHEDLPDPGDSAAILGGVWQIKTFSRTFQGLAASGSLFNNGDNTFHVDVDMLLTRGGIGTLDFDGTLSHNVFPPTIQGTIGQ